MNARRCIEVHHKLWVKRPRSFNTIRVVPGLKFVTQNLTKPGKNTDWINGDPEHRKLTWIFDSRGYTGYVREYQSQGHMVIEVWKMKPEKLMYREVV